MIKLNCIWLKQTGKIIIYFTINLILLAALSMFYSHIKVMFCGLVGCWLTVAKELQSKASPPWSFSLTGCQQASRVHKATHCSFASPPKSLFI